MICVECGRPVNDIYKEFGRGSGNIRLTRCDSCHSIADKYVEYELVIVFLDLFLHRPQAYRHLLFNRMPYRDSAFDKQLYLFFEAYIKWKVESESSQTKASFYYYGYWQDHLPHDRYWYILVTAVVEFGMFALGICLAVHLRLSRHYAILKFNYLLMAVILSSFGKGLLILMMIWDYPFAFSQLLNVFVLTSNVVALKVFLDTSTIKAMAYVACGVVMRSLFQFVVYLLDSSLYGIT